MVVTGADMVADTVVTEEVLLGEEEAREVDTVEADTGIKVDTLVIKVEVVGTAITKDGLLGVPGGPLVVVPGGVAALGDGVVVQVATSKEDKVDMVKG